MIYQILKNNNLKITRQRKEILGAIDKLGNNATISEIIKLVDIDKSTVYRNIDILIKNNIILKQVNYENKDYYVIASNHKHYVKCVKCFKIKELNNCPFDSINLDGFDIINHSLKIEGICEDCKKIK